MFQGIKNTASALNNANQLRQQQAKLQQLLSSIRVTGTSKNGKVSVTITGEQKIIDIFIDPTLIMFVNENFFLPATKEGDSNKAADLNARGQKFISAPIMEALEDAMGKVQGKVVEKMQETGSLGDLMSMLQTASSMDGNKAA